MHNHCAICKIHQDANYLDKWEITRNGLWVLRHHPEPAPLPSWLILDSIRHISGPIEFNAEEAKAWGVFVQKACSLVKNLSGCERVYAIAFGEGARHLHLHLIPRFDDDPRTKGWAIADHYRAMLNKNQDEASSSKIYNLIKKGRLLWK